MNLHDLTMDVALEASPQEAVPVSSSSCMAVARKGVLQRTEIQIHTKQKSAAFQRAYPHLSEAPPVLLPVFSYE